MSISKAQQQAALSEERYSWNFFTLTYKSRLHLKWDGTRAETRFRLSAKRRNPFKSAGASVKSTTGSRGVRISGSNVGYTMFRGSAKSTGYPLHSPVSPSLPLPCVTVCHHISTRLYLDVCLLENNNDSQSNIGLSSPLLRSATVYVCHIWWSCIQSPEGYSWRVTHKREFCLNRDTLEVFLYVR
jgi:hypothetical protein